MAAKSAKPKWSDIKRQLKDWGPQELLGLVRDLFDTFPENRQFLAARLLQAEQGLDVMEPYRQRIHEAFYTRSGLPQNRLRLADARKAIRDYQKATGDVKGTLDLTLDYVETGTAFTLEFGDIDERFYDSLCSALDEAQKTLQGEGRNLYPEYRDRLQELAQNAGRIGWGYGDYVGQVVDELEDEADES